MRSPCAFSTGASRRSAFTTTVCGPFFSKSWMPIETCSLKSRMKMRFMSFLLFGVEGDVARPSDQMLAAVDDQGVAGEGWRGHDEAQRAHQIVGRDAHAEEVLPVLALEADVGLV